MLVGPAGFGYELLVPAQGRPQGKLALEWRCRKTSGAVLVAEVEVRDGASLLEYLQSHPDVRTVSLATTSDKVLELIRSELFDRAVVAAELAIDGRPVLARLAALPSMKRLLAVGPMGCPEMEALARSAGAHAYLSRPVSSAEVAMALELSPVGAAQSLPLPRRTCSLNGPPPGSPKRGPSKD